MYIMLKMLAGIKLSKARMDLSKPAGEKYHNHVTIHHIIAIFWALIQY